MADRQKIVIIGLSITSSWGNGHATTYRGLIRELDARGHNVLFLEQDVPWYASHRDLPDPPFCRTALYRDFDELRDSFEDEVTEADSVIVGSYVQDGIRVGDWVQHVARGTAAFYDIDTPVTLAKLDREECEYLHPRQIPGYRLYLSFTGGPTLHRLEKKYGSPQALPLYCSVDPELYYPEERPALWDMGYMGTYSDDRQPPLEELLFEPAKLMKQGRFVVAGPQYPDSITWPANVERIQHLPPSEHRGFYSAQRFTLNITRADMIHAGYSPSVRLFEAAACAVPIISDWWNGLGSFFSIGREILVGDSPQAVVDHLKMPAEKGLAIGERARERILKEHTAAHRAETLEQYLVDAHDRRKATVVQKLQWAR